MQRHKLTGWLIAFIVWAVVAGVNGLGALENAETMWRPQMADHPSLRAAVMVFQGLMAAGIIAWLFTAWVLYQREPGTLKKAQAGLLVGAVLRLAGAWSIALFGGLPKEMVQRLMPLAGLTSCIILVFTAAWYYYLASSERVREIYSD